MKNWTEEDKKIVKELIFKTVKDHIIAYSLSHNVVNYAVGELNYKIEKIIYGKHNVDELNDIALTSLLKETFERFEKRINNFIYEFDLNKL